MQKFTIFTIVFSVAVVLVVADLVFNDFSGDDFASQDRLDDDTGMAFETGTISADEELSIVGIDQEETGESETSQMEDDEGLIQSPSAITAALLTDSGFTLPRLESGPYGGLIYGFWDTEVLFENFRVISHKIFESEAYTATIYEIQTDNEVDDFTAYQTLQDLARTSDTGEMNENNAYGDASFYFNHATKTNTVFLVVRQSGVTYALEYTGAAHSKMRALIEQL